MPRLALGLVTVLLASAYLAGCVGSSTPTSSSAAPSLAGPGAYGSSGTGGATLQRAAFTNTAAGGYKIGARDVLDISVFKVPDLTKTVEVADTGTVNLPLVGEISVAGKTTQQVERELAARLGKEYLQNPQVSVSVKQNNSQSVVLSGAIKKPGVYPIHGRTTLMEVVAQAGDFADVSDSTVLIVRKKGAKRYAAKFDVGAIQEGRATDPTLQTGDQIVAGTSAIKKGFGMILKALPIASFAAL